MLSLKTGDRVRLLRMQDDPDPIAPGTVGTVIAVNDFGDWSQVEVWWDNGRQLMLVMPPDQVVKLS